MSYGGAYPHIKCISPPKTTKDMVVAALYEQNAMCQRCGDPFDNDDVCCWDGRTRIEHVDCKSPHEPHESLMRGAEEKVLRAQPK